MKKTRASLLALVVGFSVILSASTVWEVVHQGDDWIMALGSNDDFVFAITEDYDSELKQTSFPILLGDKPENMKSVASFSPEDMSNSQYKVQTGLSATSIVMIGEKVFAAAQVSLVDGSTAAVILEFDKSSGKKKLLDIYQRSPGITTRPNSLVNHKGYLVAAFRAGIDSKKAEVIIKKLEDDGSFGIIGKFEDSSAKSPYVRRIFSDGKDLFLTATYLELGQNGQFQIAKSEDDGKTWKTLKLIDPPQGYVDMFATQGACLTDKKLVFHAGISDKTGGTEYAGIVGTYDLATGEVQLSAPIVLEGYGATNMNTMSCQGEEFFSSGTFSVPKVDGGLRGKWFAYKGSINDLKPVQTDLFIGVDADKTDGASAWTSTIFNGELYVGGGNWTLPSGALGIIRKYSN